MSKIHYPIGGSTAKVWGNCVAAPWLSLCAPSVNENEAMARGTRIHKYAEDMLNGLVATGLGEELSYARRYVNSLLTVAADWDAETAVNYSDVAGTTVDAVTRDDHTVRIVDLKTGLEPVDPRYNQQLIFSLLCYAREHLLPETVALGIYQELDDGSAPLRWWVLTQEDAVTEIGKMRARIDMVMVGGAPSPGKHCDRCRARGVCGSVAGSNQAATVCTTASVMMSPVQAASAMTLFPRVRKWMDGVEEAWEGAAKAGQLPGITTKPRKSPLRWMTTDVPDAWCDKKPMTPTQVVKGGHATESELLDKGLAVRPPDGFTLVYAEQSPVTLTEKVDF